MRRRMIEAKVQNENSLPFTTDSIMKKAAGYYDRHGSDNERMMAHYLLGCTYRDLGDAPRALQCYNDAVSRADTTSPDCDYTTMSRIYGQMAVMFSDNEIPQNAISSLKNVIKYGKLANDTLIVLQAIENMANAYYHMNELDSVITIRERVSAQYAQYGYNCFSALALGPAIHILIENKEYEKAKRYIDIYEKDSGVFDSCGNIEQGREIYNAFKGRYYIGIHEYDSAELCFRKCISQNNSIECRAAAFSGLHSLYTLTHDIDSIAKYAELSALTNDSIYSNIISNNSKIIEVLSDNNANKDISLTGLNENIILPVTVIMMFVITIIAIVLGLKKYNKQYSTGNKHNENNMANTGIESETDSAEKQTIPINIRQPEKSASEKAEIDRILCTSEIYIQFKNFSDKMTTPSNEDWAEMRKFVALIIPGFYEAINNKGKTLRMDEYDICILVRLHFCPYELCRLTGKSSSYISMIRVRLLEKIFKKDGKPKDFDKLICDIY